MEQSLTAFAMLIVVFVAWVIMAFSAKIFNYIGNSGAAIISRVMGLILSAVAVANIIGGFKVYFNL